MTISPPSSPVRRRRAAPLALSLLLGLAGTGTTLAQDYTKGAIRISHPWAPPSAASDRDAPGYLTMTNTGSVPDRLISASFIEATNVVFRAGARGQGAGQGASKGGQAVDGFTLNPGETVALRPGGDSLLFTGLKSPLHPGMAIQCILRFERAGTLLLEFAVEGRPGRPARGAATAKAGGRPDVQTGGAPAEQSAAAQGR